MGIEKTININVKSSNAEKELKKTNKALDKTSRAGNSASTAATKTGAAMGGLATASGTAAGGLASVGGAIGGAAIGFTTLKTKIQAAIVSLKTMRVAVMATGIGALLILLTSLKQAFTSSEEGQNKFAKLMGVIGAVTGNLLDILADLGEGLISVFEDPKQAIIDFKDLIVENITNRFNAILDTVGFLGSAIKSVFKGDFDEALESAKKASSSFVDSFTGVKNSIDKAKEATKGFLEEQKKEIGQAAAVADMRAKADKIERKLIVDRSKLESEIANLRLKSRQEEEFSAAERKQALLDAQKLEEQLLDKETEFLELRRDAQILENTFSRSNKENLTKEAEAIAAVNRQQAARANAARQVQREVNTISKQIEAENKRIANEQKAAKDKEVAEEKTRLDAIQKIRDDFALKQKEKEAESEVEKINLEEQKKLSELEKLEASEEQKLEVLKYYSTLRTEAEEKENKKKEEIEKLRKKQTLADAQGTFNSIAQLAGKDSKIGKAMAIASATISGVEGVQNAYSTAQKSPITTFFPAYPVVQAALAGAVAAKNIAAIKSVSAGGGGSTSVPVASGGGASQPPSFNVVGATETSQLAEAVGSQTQQPVQAYVVSNDITTAQSLENNIVEGATL